MPLGHSAIDSQRILPAVGGMHAVKFPEPFRLAAVDVDGTLVSTGLVVSEPNRRAIARLQAAGVEVVLASGRHYETLRPFVDALPGVRWLVSAQGGEVSDVERTLVLNQVFLSHDDARRVVSLGRKLGFHLALYTERGILVDDDTAVMGFYTQLAGKPPRSTFSQWGDERLLKVVWIGAETDIATVTDHPEVQAIDVERVRTHRQLFEFSPHGVSKATGLAALCRHLGFRAEETLAFGDAENDLPMFSWAGLSVAMPHGWPKALAGAAMVGPAGEESTALARAIESLFDGRKS